MSDFKKAIAVVVKEHEGGFQKWKNDPGNYANGVLKGTKYGISARAFPNEDIENLTIDRAVELYEKIWGHYGAIDNQLVLTKVLDLAVNWQFGDIGPATKALQRSCGAVVDGIFGPKTVAATNAADWYELLRKLCLEAHEYYHKVEAKHPEEAAFFTNWEHRASWLPPKEDQNAQVATTTICTKCGSTLSTAAGQEADAGKSKNDPRQGTLFPDLQNGTVSEDNLQNEAASLQDV